MIDAFEMSKIYYRNLKARSIVDVESLVKMISSKEGKAYWNEVLTYLNVRKNGKKSLN